MFGFNGIFHLIQFRNDTLIYTLYIEPILQRDMINFQTKHINYAENWRRCSTLLVCPRWI